MSSGNELFESNARGKLKREDEILIGDIVEFEPQENSTEYVIDSVQKRKNTLIRPKVSNVDRVLIVISIVPKPSLELIDKILINCIKIGVESYIVINKSDILTDNFVDEIRADYKDIADGIFVISAKNNENIDSIKNLLQYGLTCLCGQSAVGKSSLLNALDSNLHLQTGDISVKSRRGRHTTRHSEIFKVGDNGFIIDTPGFSLLDIEMEEPHIISSYFVDFDKYRDNCRFKPCLHINEPDCKVRENVENGNIAKTRYDRYVALITEIKNKWKNRY